MVGRDGIEPSTNGLKVLGIESKHWYAAVQHPPHTPDPRLPKPAFDARAFKNAEICRLVSEVSA
jgi:hypothetical protein